MGANHAIAITPHGTLIAAGSNANGRLGIPISTTAVRKAVELLNFPPPYAEPFSIVSVGAGEHHSIALDDKGRVWAWGYNNWRQLGYPYGTAAGQLSQSAVPVLVPFQSGVSIVEVSTFGSHTLALDTEGKLWAWGDNTYGQCGAAATVGTYISTPVQVSLGSPVTILGISAGKNHSLAITSAGVFAWGHRANGKLGQVFASIVPQPTAVPVIFVGLIGQVVKVSAGDNHNLAVTSSGEVWAWGTSETGQLGLGNVSTTPTTGPVRIPGITGAISVSAGTRHSVAITVGNGYTYAWAWGSNAQSQLGYTPLINQTTPKLVPIVGAETLFYDDAIAGWYNTAFVARVNGVGEPHVRVAGDNSKGIVADGATTNRAYPTIGLTPSAVTVACGTGGINLAVKAGGSVWEWGVGSGAGTRAKQVPVLFACSQVAAGDTQRLALRRDGTVWAWGSGFLGHGSDVSSASPVTTPVQVKARDFVGGTIHPLINIQHIAAFSGMSLAIDSSGKLWIWGTHTNTGLGWDIFGGTLAMPVTLVTDAAKAFPTGRDLQIITKAGEWKVLQQATYGHTYTGGLSSVRKIAAANNGHIHLDSAGNVNGLLASPTNPLPLADDVGRGWYHYLVAGRDGFAYSWGASDYGALGAGSSIRTTPATSPLQLPIPGGARSVTGGLDQSYVVSRDGNVWGFGYNQDGSLGVGDNYGHFTPFPLPDFFSGGVTLDTDGDGMIDSLETALFGTTFLTAGEDTDNDGVSNFAEILAGTNPTENTTSASYSASTSGQPTLISGVDSDGDGVSDEEEAANDTASDKLDSDADGVPDGDDAVPYDAKISFRRSPETRFAIVELGDFQATGLNNTGQVVGYKRDHEQWKDATKSFVWNQGTMTELSAVIQKSSNGEPKDVASSGAYAMDINDVGQIVGHKYLREKETPEKLSPPENNEYVHAVIWDRIDAQPRDLGSLNEKDLPGEVPENSQINPSERKASMAAKISDHGLIVGTVRRSAEDEVSGGSADTMIPASIASASSSGFAQMPIPAGYNPNEVTPTFSISIKGVSGSTVVGALTKADNSTQIPLLWENGTVSSTALVTTGTAFQPWCVSGAPSSDEKYALYVGGLTVKNTANRTLDQMTLRLRKRAGGVAENAPLFEDKAKTKPFNGIIEGINRNGVAIVQWFKDGQSIYAIWQNGAVRPLSELATGLEVTSLVDINDKGMVLVNGKKDGGPTKAILLMPIEYQTRMTLSNARQVPKSVTSTDTLPVSSLTPIVDLKEVATAGNTVTIEGTVYDALLNNIPRNAGKDLRTVTVFVNNEEARTINLQNEADGEPDALARHPYKGTIPPTQIPIPNEGFVHIRVETEENLVGKYGQDELTVYFKQTKNFLPATPIAYAIQSVGVHDATIADKIILSGATLSAPEELTESGPNTKFFTGSTHRVSLAASAVNGQPLVATVFWSDGLSGGGSFTRPFASAGGVFSTTMTSAELHQTVYEIQLPLAFATTRVDTIKFREDSGAQTTLTETTLTSRIFQGTDTGGVFRKVTFPVNPAFTTAQNKFLATFPLGVTNLGVSYASDVEFVETGAATNIYRYTYNKSASGPGYTVSHSFDSVTHSEPDWTSADSPITVRFAGTKDNSWLKAKIGDGAALKKIQDGSGYIQVGPQKDDTLVGHLYRADAGMEFIYWDYAGNLQRLPYDAFAGAIKFPLIRASDQQVIDEGKAQTAYIEWVASNGDINESVEVVPLGVLVELLNDNKNIQLPENFRSKIRVRGVRPKATVTIRSSEIASDKFDLKTENATTNAPRNADLKPVANGNYETTEEIIVYSGSSTTDTITDAQWNKLKAQGLLAVHNKNPWAIINQGKGIENGRPVGRWRYKGTQDHHVFQIFRKTEHATLANWTRHLYGGDAINFEFGGYGSVIEKIVEPVLASLLEDTLTIPLKTKEHQRANRQLDLDWRAYLLHDVPLLDVPPPAGILPEWFRRDAINKMFDLNVTQRSFDLSLLRPHPDLLNRLPATISRIARTPGSSIWYLWVLDSQYGDASKTARWVTITSQLVTRLGAQQASKILKKVNRQLGWLVVAYGLSKNELSADEVLVDELGLSPEGARDIVNGTSIIGQNWIIGKTVDVAVFGDGTTLAKGELLQVARATLAGGVYTIESVYDTQIVDIVSEQGTKEFTIYVQSPFGVEKNAYKGVRRRPEPRSYKVGDTLPPLTP